MSAALPAGSRRGNLHTQERSQGFCGQHRRRLCRTQSAVWSAQGDSPTLHAGHTGGDTCSAPGHSNTQHHPSTGRASRYGKQSIILHSYFTGNEAKIYIKKSQERNTAVPQEATAWGPRVLGSDSRQRRAGASGLPSGVQLQLGGPGSGVKRTKALYAQKFPKLLPFTGKAPEGAATSANRGAAMNSVSAWDRCSVTGKVFTDPQRRHTCQESESRDGAGTGPAGNEARTLGVHTSIRGEGLSRGICLSACCVICIA